MESPLLLEWLKRDHRINRIEVFAAPDNDFSQATLLVHYPPSFDHVLMPPPPEFEEGLFKHLAVNTITTKVDPQVWESVGPQNVLSDLFYHLKVR